ncbi:tRNA uridine-5-carboxymethylaminomethyl(34) synthesis enzyme MnmG [Ureaplasma canigenitalium]|uniref:tRNA uridine-5-carboxymethylaminomethyl(34) synthesis enzyme MnmG n=1 Tax=Ureaplasma canigenitalium TaxID=42092 RepID=UPI0004E0D77D|nr:tRNA uridine-5-carboxymethylaminomethyl(34) synthesis enzyme MnmG [Ureaplasma canigenitalium]
MKKYDVIVIGAGHAGLEASFASSKKGLATLLITLDEKGIGMMPCNPSIGGPAKGVVTREIDALGGMQGKAADATALQMKMLNTSKGPGVWALRCQSDKVMYHKYFIDKIKEQENLDLLINEVAKLEVSEGIVKGVVLADGSLISADFVIVTTGTYLNSVTHRGDIKENTGADNLKNAKYLSDNFKELGIGLLRLKTGTPARIKKDTINYHLLKEEPGSAEKLAFSHDHPTYLPIEKQLSCYITYTNEAIHRLIEQSLNQSAMYGGMISGIGPRYCPSIEDKVVKFREKERHQIFVEPESLFLDTMYLSGFSTSMPVEIQDKMIQLLPGFENAVIEKYAYAIEYDAIDPTQLFPTLEYKKIKNLFFAGQINGTSGYEEAAAQGLMAAINVICKKENKEPVILGRDQAYIGVMVDDLVTKGITEPYRLLTSRAEHRLYLRNDNADDRLREIGYQIGLVSQEQYDSFLQEKNKIEYLINWLRTTTIGQIDSLKHTTQKTNTYLVDYLKRPEITINDIICFYPNQDQFNASMLNKVNIAVKYEGYIKNQQENINQLRKLNNINLTSIKDYKEVPNISLETVDKLNKIQPINLDQASRISGINLSDIAMIKYYIERIKHG